MRVFVVGSCVTRDALAITPERHTCVDYIARSSFAVSTDPRPFPMTPEQLDVDRLVEGDWLRRMVKTDLRRGLPGRLAQSAGQTDALVADFIDERFDLVIQDGSAATCSLGLKACVTDLNLERIASGSPEHFESWKVGFSRFLWHAAQVGLSVLVNAPYWTGATRDKALYGAAYIECHNAALERMYDHAEDLGCRVLKYPPRSFIDPEHKWGPAPFHYEREHYTTLLAALDDLQAKLH